MADDAQEVPPTGGEDQIEPAVPPGGEEPEAAAEQAADGQPEATRETEAPAALETVAAEPGTEQAAEPGTEQAAEPGTEQAAEPGTEQAAEPGTEQAAEEAAVEATSETPAVEEQTAADGAPPVEAAAEGETAAGEETQAEVPAEADSSEQTPAAEESAASEEKAPSPAEAGAAQENVGGSKPATPAGSKPGSATGAKTASAAGSRPGSRTASAAGSRPGSAAGTKPASAAGSRPGSAAGTKPASAAGSKPGSPHDSPKAVSKPASAANSRAGSKPSSPSPGSKPPSATGTREASTAGDKPPTPKGSKPPSPKGSKPPSPKGSKPPSPKGSEPPSPSTEKTPTETDGSTVIPPPPPIAESQSSTDELDEKSLSSALNLVWSFGLNKNVPVLNLTDENRHCIMYACAHTGVLYNFKKNKQTLLQGHSNSLSCTCVSADKRWLATADKGQESLLIIWDTLTGIPVRTIFDAHPDGGVAAMAMTPDAKYLATLSAGVEQSLAIWDWTVEGETPVASMDINAKYGQQSYILFNPDDITQIVTNSEQQVIFYSWQGDKIDCWAPALSDEDFNKPVGKYSQSIFLSNSTRALTATSFGNLVVWDMNKSPGGGEKVGDKKAMKLVKLQERGLNVITTTDKFIVTGDVLGHVKFFDQTLKLMHWYQDFHLGPINSLSFAHLPEFKGQAGSEYPPDATIAARQFALRDFVAGTSSAVYAHVTTDGTNVEVIHRDHDAAVHALAAHPFKPRVVVASYSGLLKVWDYEKKQTLVSRWFRQGQMIRCVAIDPLGQYLAVGFMNGVVRVVDMLCLEDMGLEPFHYARDAITHLAFSHNSQYLAAADAEYTVSLFKRQQLQADPWMYVGRYRAHYKLIQDIFFGVQLDSDQPRLMSLGQDRVLVEYDLEGSEKDDLRVMSMDRIEQSGVPLCMAWYPPITKESFIVTANDQFKFKLYNATTKMCRKTLLGPTYGSPIQKIVVIPTADEMKDKRYIAYITDDKIGLHALPLDGNPHNAMALICHPAGVANLVASYDGKYVFTAGGTDASLHMWAVNVVALEAQSKLGGEGLVPFYGLLDGGRDGDLFKELEDYFYYAQIRSQGVDTMDSRQVTVKIPLSEIPFVMRAMGFYPSEQEVEDMLNEVKYSNYVETGQYTTEIDLGVFIKLYINHRPAFGLQPDKIMWAFEVLGFNTPGGPAMDRGDLLDLLQTKGEHMTEYELAEYLTTLLGFNEEGGSSELQEFNTSTAGDIIEQNLPEDITGEMFSNELLGFSMYANDMQGPPVPDHMEMQAEHRATNVSFA